MIAHDLNLGRAVEIHLDGGQLVTTPSDAPPENSLYLTPGWIDIQVNGFAGHDVNAAGTMPQAFEEMTLRLHAVGVTRFLPTVITHSVEHMMRCLRGVADARRISLVVRDAVAGIHLEGPFISPEDGARGAHPREHVTLPDTELFDALQEAAEGTIRLVTLAPELPGAIELIEHLCQRGIVVALGHTLGDGDAVRAAVEAGAGLSTHLGNGVPAMLPRHPNVIWEQLAEPRLRASAIFDGHHLPRSVMRVLYHIKEADRLVLTSDAVALAGMPTGIYEEQVGGKVELHPNGRLTMHGTQYLAGSASTLLDGVRTALETVKIPLAETIAMVTHTPITLLDLPERDDWTLVWLDKEGPEVLMTVVDGKAVYIARAAREALLG